MHFIETGQNVMVVLNPQSEQKDDSAIFFECLDEQQINKYRLLKELGFSEEMILKKLFPQQYDQSCSTLDKAELDKYSKKELAKFICDIIACPLPSLLSMTRIDLCNLCLVLQWHAASEEKS